MAYNFADPPTQYAADAADRWAGDRKYAMAEHIRSPETPADWVEIAYGPRRADGRPVHLHVFQPDGSDVGDPRACILLIHGGGWAGGDPSFFHPAARYFAARGVHAVCIQYRLLSPEDWVDVFDCVADCRAALGYVRDQAAALNIDPHRVAAMGDSAGGHLALVLGYPDLLYQGTAAGGAAAADAVISYNPVADFETDNHGKTHVKGPDRLSISPCHMVADTDGPLPAPTLLMHGAADTVCLVDQSQRYAATAAARWPQTRPEQPGFCRYVELPDTQHAFCLPNYSATPAMVATALQQAVVFLGELGHIELSEAETQARARL